jgi:hypothetical protein
LPKKPAADCPRHLETYLGVTANESSNHPEDLLSTP